MNVCVIPARGGSKRIPRKNIRLFCGQPMIARSIQTAIQSELFSKVIVSTDDEEVSKIAAEFGAEMPFTRPKELADDHAVLNDVMAHATDWINKNLVGVQYICCLLATAPFVRVSDLEQGYQSLLESNANYAFSACRFSFPIQRAVRVLSNNRVEMFHPEHLYTRSQDLEEAYHDAGQFYWGTMKAWQQKSPLFTKNSVLVTIPSSRVQDIDTMEDWERAERMFLSSLD